jgi:hypothetical protein
MERCRQDRAFLHRVVQCQRRRLSPVVDEDGQPMSLVFPKFLVVEKSVDRLEALFSHPGLPAGILQPAVNLGDSVLQHDSALIDLGPLDMGGQVHRDQYLAARRGELAVGFGWSSHCS